MYYSIFNRRLNFFRYLFYKDYIIVKMGLGIVDYIVFGIMLGISASIGIYYRFTGGKQKTTQVSFYSLIRFN